MVEELKSCIVAVACFCIALDQASGISLSGAWHVDGEGLVGDASLPGTLAAAHLGKRWTVHDFQTTMDLPQSEALVQEWQYVGKATWTRTVELSQADCAFPLELFLERVMWTSEAFWDGVPMEAIGGCGQPLSRVCDSLATPHVHAVPQKLLTPGKHELRIVVDKHKVGDLSGDDLAAIRNAKRTKLVEARRLYCLLKRPSGHMYETT